MNEFSQPKILVVDDEEITRLALAEMLSLEGYQVISARSGEEALQKLEEETFDLVLTDLVMREVDGLQVMEAVKELSPETVVIMLTAYGTLESALRAFELGAQDYLVKPCGIEEIVASVQKGLEKERLRRENIRGRYIDSLVGENKQLRKLLTDLQGRLDEYRSQSSQASTGQFPLAELSRLTEGIVHDMRNGLGIIRNAIGFLEDGLADSAYQSGLLKISRTLDFCELVLRNLSALGGQDLFKPQWVNLEAIVREVYFLLERKLVDVKLVMDTDPGAPEILADEGQMKQVFMNLIKNAGEAMPDGGTLTVRTRREGQMLRIEVSDTGCGISPENQERLFREFFTTKDRGYGLGLHIVNTLVKRHGGTIEVESKVGEGTTFTLHLPIESE